VQAAGELVHLRESGTIRVRPKGIREQILLYDVIGFGTQKMEKGET